MHKLFNYIIRETLCVRGDFFYIIHNDDDTQKMGLLRSFGLDSDYDAFLMVLYRDLGVRRAIELWEGDHEISASVRLVLNGSKIEMICD